MSHHHIARARRYCVRRGPSKKGKGKGKGGKGKGKKK